MMKIMINKKLMKITSSEGEDWFTVCPSGVELETEEILQ